MRDPDAGRARARQAARARSATTACSGAPTRSGTAHRRPQIEAFRTFAISAEFQDTLRLPGADRRASRRKVFGANAAAALRREGPATAKCKASPTALAELRAALPPPQVVRPHARSAEARAVMRHARYRRRLTLRRLLEGAAVDADALAGDVRRARRRRRSARRRRPPRACTRARTRRSRPSCGCPRRPSRPSRAGGPSRCRRGRARRC